MLLALFFEGKTASRVTVFVYTSIRLSVIPPVASQLLSDYDEL
jgi:hypothetical protein